MTTQTEAQELADWLDAHSNSDYAKGVDAAAKLRRLEADKDDWKDASFVFKERAVKAEARIAELEAANAELLEALRYIHGLSLTEDYRDLPAIFGRMRAAIAKHGGVA